MTIEEDLPGRFRVAGSQWSTARGLVRYWRQQDLVTIGFSRRSEADAAAGMEPVTLTALSTQPSGREERASDEIFESVLAFAAADSGRQRRADAVSRIGEEWMSDSVVIDGPTFWARTGDVVHTNEGDPHSSHGGADFIRLLVPDEVPDGFDLALLSEREIVAGRPCDVVAALPRSPDPYGETPESEVFDMISGGDSFRLSVDQDTGVILRVVKLVNDQPAEICEFLEIAINQPLDDTLFRPLS